MLNNDRDSPRSNNGRRRKKKKVNRRNSEGLLVRKYVRCIVERHP